MLGQEAMKQTPNVDAVCKEQAKKIEKVLETSLQEQAKAWAEKEEKSLREEEALVAKVWTSRSLWVSDEQIDEELRKIRIRARGAGKKESIDALKNQLCYRKQILQQAGNSKDLL